MSRVLLTLTLIDWFCLCAGVNGFLMMILALVLNREAIHHYQASRRNILIEQRRRELERRNAS